MIKYLLCTYLWWARLIVEWLQVASFCYSLLILKAILSVEIFSKYEVDCLRRMMMLVLFRFICYARGLHLPPCQWNRRGVASRSTAIPALAIGLHWSCITSIQLQPSNQHPFQNRSLYTTFRAVLDLEQTWYLQIFTFTIVIYKVVFP